LDVAEWDAGVEGGGDERVSEAVRRDSLVDPGALHESRGMKATPFRNPAGDGTTVALLVEAPDMEALQSELATPEAAETQVRDGVHVASTRMFADA
jgi:hypothetical protein